jgi:hypothetical protein
MVDFQTLNIASIMSRVTQIPHQTQMRSVVGIKVDTRLGGSIRFRTRRMVYLILICWSVITEISAKGYGWFGGLLSQLWTCAAGTFQLTPGAAVSRVGGHRGLQRVNFAGDYRNSFSCLITSPWLEWLSTSE